MFSTEYLLCDLNNGTTIDSSINKNHENLKDLLNRLDSFQKSLGKIEKEFEMEKESVLLYTDKKLITFCIKFINKFNRVFEDQKIEIGKLLKEFKTHLDTTLIKVNAIERNDHRDSVKDYPNINCVDMYIELNEIVESDDDFLNVMKFRNYPEKNWPFVFDLCIKYGNKYMDKLKYTIDIINELLNSLEINWSDNIMTIASKIEHFINKIILSKEKRQIEEKFENDNFKNTIRDDLTAFKNDFNSKLSILKEYKETIVTIQEDIIRIMKEDVNYRVNKKFQYEQEKKELNNKQSKFFGDISSLLQDVIESDYEDRRESSTPDLDAYSKTISDASFEEIGKILLEIQKFMSDERKQKRLMAENSTKEITADHTIPSTVISSSEVTNNDNLENKQ